MSPTPLQNDLPNSVQQREQVLIDDRRQLAEDRDRGYAKLRAENEQMRREIEGTDVDMKAGSHTGQLVLAVVGLAALAVIAMVTIFVIRPEKDNTIIIASILGFLVPIETALLGAAVQQVHLAVNSRLTQIVRLTAAANLAQGRSEIVSGNIVVPVEVVNPAPVPVAVIDQTRGR